MVGLTLYSKCAVVGKGNALLFKDVGKLTGIARKITADDFKHLLMLQWDFERALCHRGVRACMGVCAKWSVWS